MPEISKITLPSGTTYDIKDATARATIGGAIAIQGETTTDLSDGLTTNPIQIDGEQYTAKKNDAVFYGNKEFVFDGTKWHEFGDMSGLGSLAQKNEASAQYTPKGTITQPDFEGEPLTLTGQVIPSGTVEVTSTTTNKTAAVSPTSSGDATYTPAGECTGVEVILNTTTVSGITDAGELPSAIMPVLTTTVSDETLTIGWSAGSFSEGKLPAKGEDITVATTVKSVTQPTFEGTPVRLVTENIAVPNTYSATFEGTPSDVSVTGTPKGSVTQPIFNGTKETITVS